MRKTTQENPIERVEIKARTFLRKTKNVIRRGGWAPLLILILSIAVPGTINEINNFHPQAASLYFLDVPTTYSVGQSFPVEMRVRTNGTAINAMGFKLVYNPLYLEVTNMTTENSFCTHYIENTFDNVAGTVKLSCGIPRPGFQGDSLAVRLTVRTKLPGSPAIQADPDSILLLANDGKGSRIVRDTPSLTMNVQQL